MKLRAARIVAWGVCAAWLAAGCTPATSTSTTPSASRTPSGCAHTSWNAASTGVVNPSTQPGGTLYLWGSNDPIDSLDPARTYFTSVWNLLRMWQRGLTAFAPAPGAAGRKVMPDLATTLGHATDGNRTWTYQLRTGLLFEGGTPITSADVKYAIERLFATDVITGGPASYYLDLLDGGQHYKGPYRDRSRAGLRSISTPDARTIVFHLSQPSPDFDYLMALPASTPVPRAKDTRGKYELHPVSTGPYKIQSYLPGRSLVLVRNPWWDRGTDPLRQALPDQVDVSLTGSNTERATQELSRPSLAFDGGVPSAMATKVAHDPALRCHADDVVDNFTRFMAIEQSVAPFDNVHCRRAVQYATDKAAIQSAKGGPLDATITSTMLTPNLSSYDPAYDPYPSGHSSTGDLAKARDELRQCGHPEGFSTTLATMGSGFGLAASTAEQQALLRVGIRVTLARFHVNDFYSWIGSPGHIRQHNIGLEMLGWGPDFPTQYGFWESLVDGRTIQSPSGANFAELNDPLVQADLARAASSGDAAARLAAYRDLEHEVMSDAVYLPLISTRSIYYRNPHLTNLYVQPAFGAYDLMAIGVT
jgi:peptide/nickel transport system substrate-binding protein